MPALESERKTTIGDPTQRILIVIAIPQSRHGYRNRFLGGKSGEACVDVDGGSARCPPALGTLQSQIDKADKKTRRGLRVVHSRT
jgi:hypothetical protein